MKSSIVLILAFTAAATVSASFDLGSSEIFPRNLIVPVAPVDGRIVNGKDATPGAFPYQVGLVLTRGRISSFCGGSLISKKWVLTAAHCTDGIESVTVLLGATDRTKAEQTVTVSKDKIIIHKGWNSRTVLNDISLIKIPSVQTSKRIQTVKLPKIGSTYSSYAGVEAVTTGWGRMGDSMGVAPRLQYGYVRIITNAVCRDIYGNLITSNKICAATKDLSSPCQGDSGGPLVVKDSQTQVGLVSFGSSGGCEIGKPVAFTRITSFLDWIEENSGVSS